MRHPYLFITLVYLVSGMLNAQENVFLNRAYWKSKPTVEDVEAISQKVTISLN